MINDDSDGCFQCWLSEGENHAKHMLIILKQLTIINRRKRGCRRKMMKKVQEKEEKEVGRREEGKAGG